MSFVQKTPLGPVPASSTRSRYLRQDETPHAAQLRSTSSRQNHSPGQPTAPVSYSIWPSSELPVRGRAQITTERLGTGTSGEYPSGRARGRNRSAGRADPTSGSIQSSISDLLPARPRTRARREEVDVTLEQLRKQAKELVRAARAGDEDALARLGDLPPKLASAQLTLAREHGFRSWPELVHALEADADAFVVAATSARCERAGQLLSARPEIERDRWARLVLGRGWEGEPKEVGGPRRWPPLHYVCHSCFAPVELARELLERGADPNAYHPNEYGPMSALYGAVGVLHDPELTRVLLDSGAD